MHHIAATLHAQGVIVGVCTLQRHGVTSGEVEDHDVHAFHIAKALQAMIVELRVLNVGLAVEEGQGVLRQREVQRRLRHSGAIYHLVYPQEVTREQRLLERGRWNLIVLTDKQEQEIDQHQCIGDGINPAHECAHRPLLPAFPCTPGDELRQVDVGEQQQAQQEQRVAHPDGPQHIDERHDAKSHPTRSFHTSQTFTE